MKHLFVIICLISSILYAPVPRNFRIIDSQCKRWNELRISGSQQFTEKELCSIKKTLKGFNLIVLDLREEPHGFKKGIPTWRFQSFVEVTPGKMFKRRKKWQFYAESEESVTSRHGVGYIRLSIPDLNLPNEKTVDEFIHIVEHLGPKDWLHMHCWWGKGRTATVLCMYEFMKNPHSSFYKVIDRHYQLGGSDFRNPGSKHHIFLKRFYHYCCAKRKSTFKGTWSQWLKYKNKDSTLKQKKSHFHFRPKRLQAAIA